MTTPDQFEPSVEPVSPESDKPQPKPSRPKRKPPEKPRTDPVVLQWRLLTDQDLRATPCASCKHALWQIVQDETSPPEPEQGPLISVQVYCQVLHAWQDQILTDCSGNPR